MIKFACRKAKAIVAVSADLKEKLTQLGIAPEKIHVIYNGIDVSKFSKLETIECRRKLGLPLSKRIILFVGSLEFVKGIDVLINAWGDLYKKYADDILLVLVGDGGAKESIINSIDKMNLRGSVLLAGSRPHDEISCWMNACDIFCLPSRREGYPNVLLEALSCGRFIVASEVGGIPEIVTSDQIGMLFKPADSKDLASVLDCELKKNYFHKISPQVMRSWTESAKERVSLFSSMGNI